MKISLHLYRILQSSMQGKCIVQQASSKRQEVNVNVKVQNNGRKKKVKREEVKTARDTTKSEITIKVKCPA